MLLLLSNTEILILTIIFGLLMGSFISMLSWRLPRLMYEEAEEQLKQISVSRSACPSCQKELTWKQLFPLFSWIFAKGRCQHCQTKISARYPLIEFITMILTVYVYMTFGLSVTGLMAIVFTYFIITISVIDIEHQLILDKLSLPLMWLGLLASITGQFSSPVDAILGASTGYLILWIIYYGFKFTTGKEGMGFGDFKLLAALGAWFGVAALPQIILIASVSSIVITVLLGIFKITKMNTAQPFGPYLAIAGMVTLILGMLI